MRRLLAGALLALALFVAGCGGGASPSTGGPSGSTSGSGNGEASKAPKTVLSDAAKAADAASSVHMSGQLPANGSTIGIDLTIVSGKGSQGSLTLAGQNVDIVIIGSTGYMKAPLAFWNKYAAQAGVPALASIFADKWLKFDTKNPKFAGFTAFNNATSLFDSLTTGSEKLENKGETTYNGQDVVEISAPTKGGAFYVSATGTPYPVALVRTGSGQTGSISFTNWDESVTLTAPSGSLDFSHYGG